jgi:hypothetical protein
LLAGAVVVLGGPLWADPAIALAIAGAVVVPTARTVAGSHEKLVWPENVACAHAQSTEG